MTTKKLWLKTRLRALGKTAAGLARHLGVDGPRVYEVIGGRRALQPHEIEPTAQFLDMTMEELLKRLPPAERFVRPKVAALLDADILMNPGSGMTALQAKATSIPLLGADGEAKSYFRLETRSDLFCVYLNGKQMLPWCDDGGLVVGEKNRPPKDNDHVVIFMTINRQKTIRIVQLLHGDHPETVVVRQHNPDNGPEPIERKVITQICRVISWEDIVR